MNNEISDQSADPTRRDNSVSDEGLLSRSPWYVRLGLLLLVIAVGVIATIPLTLRQQLLFALATVGLAMLVRPNNPANRYRVLVLVMLSTIATLRYIYWRFTQSLGWFDPALDLTVQDYFFSFALLAAEIYAWITLFLGYFQTLWPLEREVVPLPDDQSRWPTVDVFIPTYNEPLSVVEPTILAAKTIDYPEDKLNVYLLDDGGREDFAEFAREAGVHYIHRPERKGAKAGNINYALQRSSGELVAIFDSDHAPVHAFLKKTVGWFLRDPKLAILQTPHVFYTPDPIEKNLGIFRKIPGENNLFYGLIQPGNDVWNASFFCGSCAVLRREALEDAGGVSTDSVTEDVQTSLRIQQHGWNTAYLRVPLAAGLATDRLSDHIGQRTRWARGMLQMMRLDNPLFARGLTLGQRLTYFNSALHFLFSAPRIVFLLAPMAFLFFNGRVLQASAGMIAVYALHHIFQTHIANSAMQSSCRHSFWAEVYETVLAGKILVPTLLSFLFPSRGRFNVTKKQVRHERNRFDWASTRFVVLLLLINIAGIAVGLWRLSKIEPFGSGDTGTLIFTMLWAAYNVVITGAAVAVGFEQQQRRDAARIPRRYDARLDLDDGRSVAVETADLSLHGVGFRRPSGLHLQVGQPVKLNFYDPVANQSATASGSVVNIDGLRAGVKFAPLSAAQAQQLVYFTHARSDAWKGWFDSCDPKKPLSSFFELVRYSMAGIASLLAGRSLAARPVSTLSMIGSWLVMGLLVMAGIMASSNAQASVALSDVTVPSNVTVTDPAAMTAMAGSVDMPSTQDSGGVPLTEQIMPFKKLGMADDIDLRGGNTQNDVWFSSPSDSFVTSARVDLVFHFAPDVADSYRALVVRLNGQEVGRVPLDKVQGNAKAQSSSIELPSRFVLSTNQLSFRLEPRVAGVCPRLAVAGKQARISSASKIVLQTRPVKVAYDLAALPAPFFDPARPETLTLPFVISRPLRSNEAVLKASAIVAGWFGALADYRHADFPVVTEAGLGQRYAVMFAMPGSLPSTLGNDTIEGPSVMFADNPNDPFGAILVVMGRDEDELIAAAKALVKRELPAGRYHLFAENDGTTPRKTRAGISQLPLQSTLPLTSLKHVGAPPVQRGESPNRIDYEFRVPPDMFDWYQENPLIRVTTAYEYRGAKPRKGAHLDIAINDEWIDRVPLDGSASGQSLSRAGNQIVIKGKHLSTYPAYRIPGRSKLSYYFDLGAPADEDHACEGTLVSNTTTSIGPGSFIDLRGMDRFVQMPDLAKFINQGYPFSRSPSLASMRVYLPASPTAGELHVFLNAMGLLGSVSNGSVGNFDLALAGSSRHDVREDNLFIGLPSRLPELNKYVDYLPIHYENGGTRLAPISTSGFQKLRKWLKGELTNDQARINELLADAKGAGGVVAGFQYGPSRSRSGIALMANGNRQADMLARALVNGDLIGNVQGDVALLVDGQFESARVLPTEGFGVNSGLKRTWMFFRTYPLALLLATVSIAFGGAWLVFSSMRRRAAHRLGASAHRREIAYE